MASANQFKFLAFGEVHQPPARTAIGYRVINYNKGYIGLLNLVFTGIRQTLDCDAVAKSSAVYSFHYRSTRIGV